MSQRKISIEEKIQYEFMGLPLDTIVENPFDKRTRQDIDKPHLHVLRMMRNPDYFYFTCKSLMNGPNGKPMELLPFQCAILKELWYRPFPMLIASRGAGKSFLLGLYALLRALFIPGRKIVITGSGFRQAKTVFNYAETIWNNSPILQSLVSENAQSGPHHDNDRWWLRVGDSTITALPLGSGEKIRGERANDILCDEFASVPWEIFETVVSGFAVVELDPVDKVRRKAEIRVMRRENVWTPDMAEQERKRVLGNQTVISGTAYYQFNHFYTYWQKWKGIIESRGDKRVLENLFPGGIDDNFDYRDYSVIRIPVNLLPEGFMDERQVARSKATQHSSIFLNEFGASFASDSNGFFKRSLVESCVTKSPIMVDGSPVQFRAVTKGFPNGHYVFGIDPASENDRFSIVILEVYPNHRRVVFCWTTTRKDHVARIKAGLKTEADFYGFCARKIRDLMKSFPCEHLALDSQGGGVAVAEALHDPEKMEQGEKALWPITSDHPLSDGKERESDTFSGQHIIELVSFAKADWVAEANHGLRKDFEDKVLLFPEFDPGILAIANEEDQRLGRIFDTLESVVDEVEEIKEELATIVHTQTPNTFRDHWDTPEVKLAGSRKGRLRKDRYSALLMANSAARRLNRHVEASYAPPVGGFIDQLSISKADLDDRKMYTSAPDWFRRGVEGDTNQYGWVAKGHGVE